jgi:hypothetical protein
MSIRLPLQTIYDNTSTNQGTTSVAGGWNFNFKLPQDTDNVVVKFTASVTAGGARATFQTSDDGGTTFYDVASTSVLSGGVPQWLSIPTISAGINPQVVSNTNAASVVGGSIGPAVAGSLGSQEVSGLPVLGLQNRIFLETAGNATAVSARMQVMVNNQSATA